MRIAVTWLPDLPASIANQKRMAAENLGTSSRDDLLEVIQPNGQEKAWDRSGREHPIPPRP